MALTITHSTVVAIPDDPPAGGVGEIAWNDDHVITGSQPLSYLPYSSTGNTLGTEEYIRIPTGTFTLTLTNPAVIAGQGWNLGIKNAGTGVVTLSGIIDGGTSWVLTSGVSVTLKFDFDSQGWEVF